MRPPVPPFTGQFAYEWHDADGQWWRSDGNEQWEFDAEGLMRCREAGLDDVAVPEAERRIFRAGGAHEQGAELPLQ